MDVFFIATTKHTELSQFFNDANVLLLNLDFINKKVEILRGTWPNLLTG